MIKSSLIGILALCASLQATALTLAIPGGGGSATNFGFGYTINETFGQTFMAPVDDNVLDSFTFRLRSSSGSTSVGGDKLVFSVYVGTWTGTQLGTVVWSQTGLVGTSYVGTQAEPFEGVTFNTGGIDLVSDQQYVAFILATGFVQGFVPGEFSKAGLDVELSGSDYAGGVFVYDNSANNFVAPDFESLRTTKWDCIGCLNQDAAFGATFSRRSTVPEPTSIVLLGLGLVGLAVSVRRKRP